MSTGVDARPAARIHLFTAVVCAVLLAISIRGSKTLPGFPELWALLVLLAPAMVPAVLWHDRRRYDKRDAALTLPWVLTLCFLIPFPVLLSARLGVPLRDAAFRNADRSLGFDVPALVAWTSHHFWIKSVLERSYPLLFILLPLAALLPALAGKKRAAETFLVANTVAFLLAAPLFMFFPAIGPWAGGQFAPSADQAACEKFIHALRGTTAVATIARAGIICFPSFHVIWAAISAVALWSFRGLRYISTTVAALVICSTVTTGWHYRST